MVSYSHVKLVMTCYFCTAFILVCSTLAFSLETVSFLTRTIQIPTKFHVITYAVALVTANVQHVSYLCENTTKKCKCGKTYHGMIKCNEESGKAYVLNCYCVAYNEESNSIQAGLCFYNCETNHQVTMNDSVCHLLPANPVKDLCVVDLTGQVYCVVGAKKICILSCFPTISLV